ncbi:hypothetical protein C0J52_06205 [Blattella germanica]|nr:hypothetical protein C0J52_06205 [Blattella germanica]
MWWKKKINHLPFTEGPYIPGCADVMTEYSRDGCFVRLYYPTSLSHGKNHSAHWIPWLPHDKYLEGFSRVLQIWKCVIRFFLWLYAGTCYIPVVKHADVRKDEKLPVIIFSHGLGASRFVYSVVCTELASHGDKSSCATFYYKNEERFTESSPSWLNFKVIRFGSGHFTARKKQVSKRVEECKKVIELMENLNSGSSIVNVLHTNFNLSQFKGRLNLTNMTMMGHSFGGATALLALKGDRRLKFGVILDPWMFPLKEESDLSTCIKQPLLFVNTETFHITSNYNALKKYIVTPDGCGERTSFTIRQTTHESQSDTPHLVGYWLNWKMKKLPPVVASKINNLLILDFYQKHIGTVFIEGNSSSKLMDHGLLGLMTYYLTFCLEHPLKLVLVLWLLMLFVLEDAQMASQCHSPKEEFPSILACC